MQVINSHKRFFDDERSSICDNYYRAIVQSMHDYIYIVWVENGVPVYTEHHPGCKAVTGYDLQDYQNDPDLWYKMVCDEHKELVLKQARDIIAGKKAEPIEHRIIHKSGEIRWVRNTVSPCFDNEGNVIAYFGLVTDITEQKRSEEELQRYYAKLEQLVEQRTIELQLAKEQAESANRAKTTFLARVSHDLRTPLTGIMSLLETLSELLDQNSELKDVLKFQTETLLGLIHDFHDIAKVEQGTFTLENDYLHPHALVNSLANFFSLLAQKKGLSITTWVSPAVSELYIADTKRVRQLLMNLINNAIKYTEKGRVELRVDVLDDTSSDSLLCFSVKDTGIGIPEEKLDDIFKPFVQAHSGSIKEGVGLGLSICNVLAEAMSGRLSVQSVLGEGSTFCFEVRFKKALDFPGLKAEQTSTATPQIDKALKILVVEDDMINCEIIRGILQKNGFDVEIALNGKEALDKIFGTQYDLIFMDINMPVMDGYEASRHIRQHESYNNLKRTPIIAFTAHDKSEVQEQIKHYDIDDVLNKPVSKQALLQMIAKWA